MESLGSPGANFAERLTGAIGAPLVVGVVILALVAFAVLTKGTGQLGRLKVRPRPLMTQAERRVCAMIEEALPGARVHSQVSMGAIMQPDKGLSKLDWWKSFNRFSSKRVDFVVEDPASGEVIVLVELDDATHKRRADDDRDALTRHAGYQTVRISGGRRPTQQSVTALLQEALGLQEARRKNG